MPNTLLHRAAAITVGALAGLTTLMAAPAHAAVDGPTQQVEIAGSAECNRAAGEWTVTWTVTNNWTELAKVDKLQTAPAPVPGLENGIYIPRRAASGTMGKQVFTQLLKGSPAQSSVSFVADWGKAKDPDNKATVQLGKCDPPPPPCVQKDAARFHHEFAVKDGQATASVTLDDGIDLCDDEPVTLVTYFAPSPQLSYPQYVFASQTATIGNDQRTVTLSAKLPECNNQTDLFFGGESDISPVITEDPATGYGDRLLGSGKGSGGRSTGPEGQHSGGAKGCNQPVVQPVSRCDGTVDVNLSNPADKSKYPVTFTVQAGEFTKTVTVDPGKGDTVRVPAGSGAITVKVEGEPDVTYTWTRPENCAPPTVTAQNDCKLVTVTVTNPQDAIAAKATVVYGTESRQVTVAPGTSGQVQFPAGEATEATVTFDGLGIEPITVTIDKPTCDGVPGGGGGSDDDDNGDNGDDGGGLPVTGAAAGAIAAGAGVLLIGGGVLFLLARRRRVTFTP